MEKMNEPLLYVKEAVFDELSINEITRRISEVCHAPVCITDMKYRIIAKNCSYRPRKCENKFVKNFLEELSEKHVLSLANISMITDKDIKQAFIDYHIYSKQLFVATVPVARVFVLFDERSSKNDGLYELMEDITVVLEKYFLHSEYANVGYSVLDKYVDMLFNGQFPTESLARETAEEYGISFPRVYTGIVVQTAQDSMIQNESGLVRSRLEAIFPEALVTRHDENFLLIIPSSYKKLSDANLEEFKAFLTQTNSYAGACFPSRYVAGLAEMYNLGILTVKIATSLKGTTSERLFEFNDYHALIMMHLCNSAIEQSEFTTSIIHLCNPGFLRLQRYDKANNVNLASTLQLYFENNCNASKTAEQLFMHRNTLMRQVSQAASIMNCDIDDPNFQLVYRLSSLIKEYVEKVKGGDLDELKGLYSDYSRDVNWDEEDN